MVYFFDRALATFCSQLAGDYRSQLAAFQAEYRKEHPAVQFVRRQPSDQQIEHLKGVDQTPFRDDAALDAARHVALPQYGGNRDRVGWKLIGFEISMSFARHLAYYAGTIPASSLTQ